jgi:hypothetical protein
VAVVATIAKGYDLDYMWASTAAPAGEYYIAVAEAGEPPGRWWGPGAQALGLAAGALQLDMPVRFAAAWERRASLRFRAATPACWPTTTLAAASSAARPRT